MTGLCPAAKQTSLLKQSDFYARIRYVIVQELVNVCLSIPFGLFKQVLKVEDFPIRFHSNEKVIVI